MYARAPPMRRSDSISSASATLTPGWSRGSSRNQRYQAADQTNADRAADDEDAAPGQEGEQPGDEQRRHAAGNMRGGEEEALHAAALAQRNPAREGERGIGPRAGLARAEQKADDQQAGVVPRRRRSPW